MKRILCTLLLLGATLTAAEAQNWQSLLRGLVGSSKSEQTEQTKTDATAARLTADQLLGEWLYTETAMEYTGSDLLASLATAGLKGQVNEYCNKAGLTPGRDGVTFSSRNDVVLSLAGHHAAGTYSYHSLKGVLTLTLKVENKSASFRGTATMADGILTLLFDANEALQVVRTIHPSIDQNSHMQTLAAIIEKYPGLQIGCKLRRAGN